MRAAKWRVVALLLLLAGLAVGLAEAEVVVPGGFTIATLKEQLTFGLQARTPAEQAFVDEVVTLVNSNTLPLDLVQSTFLWARKKQRYKE
ncbi:MAG TPA: hypothetical protein VGI75_06275, partial [Pirellulales bacterium]